MKQVNIQIFNVKYYNMEEEKKFLGPVTNITSF